MEFKYNKDWETRDKLIFGKADKSRYMGGCRRFSGVNYRTLCTLLEEKFIDPQEAQNNSPTTEEIMSFMKEYPDFTAHGYVVSIDRDDYRVTIEGVDGSNYASPSMELLTDFINLFRYADDFDIHSLCCWYD